MIRVATATSFAHDIVMKRDGFPSLDEPMSPISGPRLLRPLLATIACFATTGLLAGPALAAEQGSLPVVTISTTAPIQTSGPSVIGDGTGMASDSTEVSGSSQPASQAVIHKSHHVHLQTIDTTSLSTAFSSTGTGGAIRAAVPMVMEARATALRPAPLPDRDMEAPGPDVQALAAQGQASLAPSVYGHSDHFSGDGFAAGSNLESDKNNRRRPGGGMSLSIPVQ